MSGRTLRSAWHAAATVPARARHGRPGRITARALLAATAGTAAAALIPGTPAAPAIQAAAALWMALTAAPELAPPAADPSPHGRAGQVSAIKNKIHG
jgi:hypothetical protein